MNLDLRWGDTSKTYLYTHFHHNWTWDELHQNRVQQLELMKSVIHRVDWIADLTDTQNVHRI